MECLCLDTGDRCGILDGEAVFLENLPGLSDDDALALLEGLSADLEKLTLL